MPLLRPNDLRDLTDEEQVTLVQNVLRNDKEAIETFWDCTKRLLTFLAAHSPMFYNDRAYEIHDLVAVTFTHLVYGLRLSGPGTPPLQTWLANREKGIPLARHVANYADWFLRSLAKQRRIETVLHNADKEETDNDAPRYYDTLPANAYTIEETTVHITCRVWWEQRAIGEHTLLNLLAPTVGAMTLADAAQQLDMSIPTVHRRRKHLLNDLVTLLKAA